MYIYVYLRLTISSSSSTPVFILAGHFFFPHKRKNKQHQATTNISESELRSGHATLPIQVQLGQLFNVLSFQFRLFFFFLYLNCFFFLNVKKKKNAHPRPPHIIPPPPVSHFPLSLQLFIDPFFWQAADNNLFTSVVSHLHFSRLSCLRFFFPTRSFHRSVDNLKTQKKKRKQKGKYSSAIRKRGYYKKQQKKNAHLYIHTRAADVLFALVR